MPEPYYVDDTVTIDCRDCVEVLRELPAKCIDASR